MATQFQVAMEKAINHVTGYPVHLENTDNGSVMITYIARQLQNETGIDSEDWSKWIHTSVTEYIKEYIQLPREHAVHA